MSSQALETPKSSVALQRRNQRLSQCEFEICTDANPDRAALQTYIADCYQKAYEARVASFLPLLLRLDSASRTHAALGLRPGYCGAMYLEKYLQAPIEQALAEQVKQPVMRDTLVEVGNLVSTLPGSSQLLFVTMTAAVDTAGYRWMTFTATRQVGKLIERLHYQPVHLNDASASCLGAEAAEWGSYYEMQPSVLAGNVREAMLALQSHAETSHLIHSFRSQINYLAQCLRDHRRIYAR